MTRVRTPLSDIVALAQTQGHLTYDQVNAFLPDEAKSTVLLNKLQVALITPLMHFRGYGAPETKAAALRARTLIERAEAGGELCDT